MDETFGVANNKQYVELKKVEPEEIDLEEEEVRPMWCQLYKVIAPTINEMYRRNQALRASSNNNTNEETREQPTSIDIVNEVEENNNEQGISTEQKNNFTEEERIEKIKETYQISTEQALKFAKNNINIEYKNVGSHHPIFDYKIELGIINITINTSHIFYEKFLEKIYELDESAKIAFELFIVSYVKSVDIASCKSEEYQKAIDNLSSKWLTKITEYTMELQDIG